jgi:hypothetical protein
MTEDVFLFSLVMNAAKRRGRKFVLKATEAEGVVDKWLYLLSGVPPRLRKQSLITSSQRKSLELAADILNRLPIYVEQPSDGSTSQYVVELNI